MNGYMSTADSAKYLAENGYIVYKADRLNEKQEQETIYFVEKYGQHEDCHLYINMLYEDTVRIAARHLQDLKEEANGKSVLV